MIDYLGERIEFFYEMKDNSDEKKLLWVSSIFVTKSIAYLKGELFMEEP